MPQTVKKAEKEKEKTLFHGNSGWLSIVLLFLIVVCGVNFSSYKQKLLAEMKYVEKKTRDYERNRQIYNRLAMDGNEISSECQETDESESLITNVFKEFYEFY